MRHHTTASRTSTDLEYDSQVVFGSESILAPSRGIKSEADEMLRRICLHESGHAVLSVLFGRVPREISIIADEDSQGRMIASQPPGLRERLAICYAGAAGEAIEFETFNQGHWQSDLLDADRLLERAGFNVRRRLKPWTISVNRHALEDAQRLTKRFAATVQQVADLLEVQREVSGASVSRLLADSGMTSAILGV